MVGSTLVVKDWVYSKSDLNFLRVDRELFFVRIHSRVR